MKIAVVICEYNPLQNGHVYHLSRAKSDTGADYVVCIMSGNFSQRGECAVRDKYTRAVWAVKNGADMVVELPPQYVLTTAKYFAFGGVKIATQLKGDVSLSFGSELGDVKKLKELASIQENEAFKNALKSSLDEGNGYAKSYGDALKTVAPQSANDARSPNNILAIEYIKALKEIGGKINAHTVKRLGGDYHGKNAKFLCSASAVRQMCQDGDFSSVKDNVPPCVFEDIDPLVFSKFSNAKDRLFYLLKFNATDISNIHGLKEGIENRIASLLKECDCWNEFWNKLTTKRYTDAYLLRTLANVLIKNKYSADDLLNEKIEFVNVLAVSQKGKNLLSAFECKVATKQLQIPSDSLIHSADNAYSCLVGNFKNHMQTIKN